MRATEGLRSLQPFNNVINRVFFPFRREEAEGISVNIFIQQTILEKCINYP